MTDEPLVTTFDRTAALYAVMEEDPDRAKEIISRMLHAELLGFYLDLSALQVMVATRLRIHEKRKDRT